MFWPVRLCLSGIPPIQIWQPYIRYIVANTKYAVLLLKFQINLLYQIICSICHACFGLKNNLETSSLFHKINFYLV